MFVIGFALMSDLKVLIEMGFWVDVGNLFHSREHKRKNEWNDDVSREWRGMSVGW